jgi:hypothetical protein
VYWCWDSRLGIRLGVGLLLSVSLNSTLKMILHDPRPYWFDPRVRLLTAPEISFGLPSGHSQHTAVIWGTIGAYLRRGWGWGLAVAMIFFVGLSRMQLGVHFPTDVFAGWTIGVLLVILFARLENSVSTWMKGQSEIAQIAIVFVLSLALAGTSALVSGVVSATWQLPGEWVRNAVAQAPDHPPAPFALDDLIVSASAFFGLTAGAIWLNRRQGVSARGPWYTRLGRYAVGVVGVFVLRYALGALFDLIAADGTLAGYVLRYVRYALIGAWISALAPLTFIRLGLAKSE